MAEDEGKEEEKFDFTREGEAVGYISLDQARALAMQTAKEAPGDHGSKIAYVSNEDSTRKRADKGDAATFNYWDIWVMNADGSNQTNLTSGWTDYEPGQGRNQYQYPSWSPDGNKIAFTLNSGDIWMSNSDGSDLRQFTFTDQVFLHLVWIE